MAKISFITKDFAVAPQLAEEDFAELRAKGFAAIISNRPDTEDGVSLPARKAATLAWRAGIKFRHVPTRMDEVLDDEIVSGFEAALREADGPVLAYCKSGTRAAILWALVAARQRPVDCVLAALIEAGYDLHFLRDDLEAQAARPKLEAELVSLDCSQRTPAGVEQAAAA
jgi:uncharacterized protein (TIGR01244 family)